MAALAALGLEGKRPRGVERDDDDRDQVSFRNLPEVQLIEIGELNAYDVLCNDWIVFTTATLPGEREVDDGPAAEATASRRRSSRRPQPEPAEAPATRSSPR